jgi:hypothetical protein
MPARVIGSTLSASRGPRWRGLVRWSRARARGRPGRRPRGRTWPGGGRGPLGSVDHRPPTGPGRPATGAARPQSSPSLPGPRPAGLGPAHQPAGAAGHGRPGRLAPPGWPGPRRGIQQGRGVAVAVGVDPEGRRQPGPRAWHGGCSVQPATVGWPRPGLASPRGGRTVRGHAPGRTGFFIRPATMVGQAGAGSSRTGQPQGTPGGGQRGLGSRSLPAPACSTQTRRHRQHHSEAYCEREVDEVEWQGGRVHLHLGARRDDPPRR